MRRSIATALLGGALALLTACSTPSNAPDDYDEQTQENFLLGCTRSLADADDYDPDDTSLDPALQDICQCRYDYFVETVPFNDSARDDDPERFADYQGPTFTALNDDAGAGDPLPEEMLTELEDRCGTAETGLPAGADDALEPSADDTDGSTSTTAGDDESTSTTAGDTSTTAESTTTTAG